MLVPAVKAMMTYNVRRQLVLTENMRIRKGQMEILENAVEAIVGISPMACTLSAVTTCVEDRQPICRPRP